jgi:hypothetical protein
VLTEADTLAMPEIEASIGLAAIYAEVEFPPPDAAEA